MTFTNDLFVFYYSKRRPCIILHLFTNKKVSAMKRCLTFGLTENARLFFTVHITNMEKEA